VLKVLGGGVGVDVAISHELNVPSVNVLADVEEEGDEDVMGGVYGGHASSLVTLVGVDVDPQNENVPSVNVKLLVAAGGTS
jgi:hypothetical protein